MSQLPDLPLAPWKDTKTTLHLYLQIVGKIRMTLHPKLNHWWHVPLYVSARGLTTQGIPLGDRTLELEFDLIDHALDVRCSTGASRRIELLDGLSVATFHERVMAATADLGVDVRIKAEPYDPDRVGSRIPFAEDEKHHRYDPDAVNRFWRILSWVNRTLTEFKCRFNGKSTPVHLFWHSLDLAYTRFSGRSAPLEGGTAADREAYSHEVISFGFWAGDDQVPAPAFYSYVYPEPKGLKDTSLQPEAARWNDNQGSAMALLMYDDIKAMENPRVALLAFLESAYRAGAELANWEPRRFEVPA